MNKSALYGILAAVICLSGCCGREYSAGELRSADLVFVGLPAGRQTDTLSLAEGIASATGNFEDYSIIHVAIVEAEGDSLWIIDATPEHGVARRRVAEFVEDFRLRDGSLPEFIACRLIGDIDAGRVIRNARSHLGKSYNHVFLPSDTSLYCSELVRECYTTPAGAYLFEEIPMNFLDRDGKLPPYWAGLYDSLGIPVPQGEPGTNPADMMRSPLLRRVNVSVN